MMYTLLHRKLQMKKMVYHNVAQYTRDAEQVTDFLGKKCHCATFLMTLGVHESVNLRVFP